MNTKKFTGSIRRAAMPLIVSTCYVILSALPTQAQFQRTYQSPNSTSWGHCIQQTADGGYIIAGDDEVTGFGDPILIKTNASGTIQWTFNYNFPAGVTDGRARHVIESHDPITGIVDGYVMTGWVTTTYSGRDLMAARLDVNGGLMWFKYYNNPAGDRYNEQGFCVRQNPVTGDYVVTGLGEIDIAGLRCSKLLLVQLDSRNGAKMWDNLYGTNASAGNITTGGFSLDEYDSDGNGTFDGWVVAGWTHYNTSTKNQAQEDVYIVAVNSVGTVYSQKRIGVTMGINTTYTSEMGFSVQQISTGDIIVSGQFANSTYEIGQGRHAGGPFLLSLNRSLSTVNFMRTYRTPDAVMNAGFCVRETTVGLPGFVIASGGSAYNYPWGTSPNPSPDNSVMFHTSSTGLTVDWANKYAASGSSQGASAQSLDIINGGYVLTGMNSVQQPGAAVHLVKTDMVGRSYGCEASVDVSVETETPYLVDHGTVINLDLDETAPIIDREPTIEERIQCPPGKATPSPGVDPEATSPLLTLYPNPVRSGDKISFRPDRLEGNEATLTVSDILGKVVYSKKQMQWKEGEEVQVETGTWAPGTYTLTLYIDGKELETRKVLVVE